jgi:hypothetical protein
MTMGLSGADFHLNFSVMLSMNSPRDYLASSPKMESRGELVTSKGD